MGKKKILFVSQEIAPYIENSEVATLSLKLSQGIQEKKYEIRTFMPNYGSINERRNQLHEVIRLSGMLLNINDHDNPLIVKVATLSSAKIQVYFVESKDLFDTKTGVLNEDGLPHDNNTERAIFFARGVFETVKKLRWVPDIVHCQGWFAGMAVLYLKKMYHDDPLFKDTKIVLSLFDDTPEVPYGKDTEEVLKYDKIQSEHITEQGLDYSAFIKVMSENLDGMVLGPISSEKTSEIESALKKEDVPYTRFEGADDLVEKVASFYESL
ncbi:MAG: glycogen/starch synthase [Porphyromonas sp.]|nr:glycogen/starch synthase [Porphyromonas sp.]